MQNKDEVNKKYEEYAHEFGFHHSVQESDAKIDLTKFLLSKKDNKKKGKQEEKNTEY